MGTLSGAPAVLDGFTVQHGFPGAGFSNLVLGGAVVLLGNAIVQNNTVSDNQSCGIHAAYGDNIIRFNHVLRSTASGIPYSVGCSAGGGGIAHYGGSVRGSPLVYPPVNVLIYGNLVEQNNIIVVTENPNETVTVTANTIREAPVGAAALFLQNYQGTLIVSDNLIYNNAGTGINYEQFAPAPHRK